MKDEIQSKQTKISPLLYKYYYYYYYPYQTNNQNKIKI